MFPLGRTRVIVIVPGKGFLRRVKSSQIGSGLKSPTEFVGVVFNFQRCVALLDEARQLSDDTLIVSE